MKSLIANAIQENRLIRLEYEGRARTVVPYALGLKDNKREALLCWQVSPAVIDGQNWRLFELNKIFGLLVLAQTAEQPPEGRQPPMEMFGSTYEITDRV